MRCSDVTGLDEPCIPLALSDHSMQQAQLQTWCELGKCTHVPRGIVLSHRCLSVCFINLQIQ